MPKDAPRQAAPQATGMGHSGQLATLPPPALTPYARYMVQAGFHLVARTEGHGPESDWERQFYVVAPGNDAPRDHAWATARFAIDGMAEHAALLARLMPPEEAGPQRERALLLGKQYRRLAQHLDVQGPPHPGEVRSFTRQVGDELGPLIAFAQECRDLQASGELRCLAWPLLLDHARRDAERWEDRLGRIGGGDVALDPRGTAAFWGQALDETCRFVAHLLDPSEQPAIRRWLRRSEGFQAAAGAVAAHGKDAAASEVATLLELADEAVQAMTELCRDVEAVRVQGILAPGVADHWRRAAVWAAEELRRAQAA